MAKQGKKPKIEECSIQFFSPEDKESLREMRRLSGLSNAVILRNALGLYLAFARERSDGTMIQVRYRKRNGDLYEVDVQQLLGKLR